MPKRRRKYTWFPVVGTVGPGETGDNFNQRFFALDIAPNGNSAVEISPVVPDVPSEGDEIDVNAPGQLVQAIGQEYIIERIVGKVFLTCQQPVDDPPTTVFPKSLLVGCGFFVARASDQDAGGGPNTPIGSASLAERQENYSPLSEDAIREPWMWRRVWVLHTQRGNINANARSNSFGPVRNIVAGTGLAFTGGAPNTNTLHGSALDGPHFDIKSVRRVGNDERLYFVVAARTLDVLFNAVGEQPNQIGEVMLQGVIDFRVLGQLRRAHNRSNF